MGKVEAGLVSKLEIEYILFEGPLPRKIVQGTIGGQYYFLLNH